jgi:hypothetical protein
LAGEIDINLAFGRETGNGLVLYFASKIDINLAFCANHQERKREAFAPRL